MKTALDAGDSTLVRELALEMVITGRRIWIDSGLNSEAFALVSEYAASVNMHAGPKDQIGLLKATLNMAERWADWLDSQPGCRPR
jgi:hypothetical protein